MAVRYFRLLLHFLPPVFGIQVLDPPLFPDQNISRRLTCLGSHLLPSGLTK